MKKSKRYLVTVSADIVGDDVEKFFENLIFNWVDYVFHPSIVRIPAHYHFIVELCVPCYYFVILDCLGVEGYDVCEVRGIKENDIVPCRVYLKHYGQYEFKTFGMRPREQEKE